MRLVKSEKTECTRLSMFTMKTSRLIVLLVLLLAIYCSPILKTASIESTVPYHSHQGLEGQIKGDETPEHWPRGPINCETFQEILDNAIFASRDSKGTYLIVIARLGTGERSEGLNLSRVAFIEDYLKRKDIIHVSAWGSPVVGLGRLEFYVGGKLLTIVPIQKNKRTPCLPWRTP